MNAEQELDTHFQHIFNDGKYQSCSKNNIILHPGDEPVGVSIITQGAVRSYSITDKGYESLAYINKPPDIIPLSWAISGNKPTLFFEAITDVQMIILSREVFLDRVCRDQDVLMRLLGDSVQKIEVITERINNTQFHTSRERVAYALLGLARQFGEDDDSGKRIALPVTHQFISESVGLSRETTSRQIEKLIKDGVIFYSGRTLYIKDVDYLSSVVK